MIPVVGSAPGWALGVGTIASMGGVRGHVEASATWAKVLPSRKDGDSNLRVSWVWVAGTSMISVGERGIVAEGPLRDLQLLLLLGILYGCCVDRWV